jgi:hypothetical protein
MQHEAPDEPGGRQRHGLVAADAVCVAREVGQDLLWSGERRLGVDVPPGVLGRRPS